MKDILFLDLETFSTIPIKYGIYKYAEQAEILIFAYAFNDEPVNIWDLTVNPKMPKDLELLLAEKNITWVAHNSNFDRVILEKVLGITHRHWEDTLVRAYRHSLPGSLAELCSIYRLPADTAKDKKGKALIHLFCKPLGKTRKLDRADRLTHPKKWEEFVSYARNDITAMRVLYKRLPTWNDTQEEHNLWMLDQKINDRGIPIDKDLAVMAVEALKDEKERNNIKTQKMTSGCVQAATQRDKLLSFMLSMYRVSLPNMQASTLQRRLEDPNLPEAVKELIRVRIQSTKTSTRKYQTLLNATNIDDMLRGTLVYCGAFKTGRWAGRTFQPHNLPRPSMSNGVIEIGIEAIKAGCVDLLFDNVNEICSSAIRGVIRARKGNKFVISDLSSIEGRDLAWLAGEQWKIKAYEAVDKGIGYDMYKLTYANTFGIKPEDVDKDQRQIGKTLELGLGYGGGVGAFVTFANAFNIDLNALKDKVTIPPRIKAEAHGLLSWYTEQGKSIPVAKDVFIVCDSIKRMWREANPCITKFWRDLEQAFRQVIYGCGTIHLDKVSLDRKGAWVRIRLPSGRYLCYPSCKLVEGDIAYMSKNPYTRKWERLKTYGGKLAENVTQAGSRDIIAHSLTLAESKGYNVVCSVHDELICETLDTPKYNHQELSSILSTNPIWATGLPLSASGFESYRYRK